MEDSLSSSFILSGRISHHRHKQIRDAGCSHISKCGELLTVATIEQQNRAPEYLSFLNRPERPCRDNILWIHHHLGIPRLELLHAAPQHLSLIHISEPTRLGMISYAVFCLKKQK